MYHARLVAGVGLSAAIPLGAVGASAFNPDNGLVLHSEVLWRIFGIMCEGGVLLLMGFVGVVGLVTVVRKILAIGRSAHA
jgi:hypothetical protein